MGGDGGTVAADRRYLRGAGSASHTADSSRHKGGSTTGEDEKERLKQIMTTCAITGQVLDLSSTSKEGGIVACPYGRLYGREAAVQALLRRREAAAADGGGGDHNGKEQPEPDIGWHVRGLKDLHPVRFQVTDSRDVSGKTTAGGGGAAVAGAGGTNNGITKDVFTAVCPLTGVELNGSTPAVLIVQSKKKKRKSKDESSGGDGTETEAATPNVVSERAIREVGADSLQEEYGPFDLEDCIRLAPTMAGGVLDKIKADLERKRAEEKNAKDAKKKGKKKLDKKRKKEEEEEKKSAADGDERRVAATDAGNGGSSSSSNPGKKPRHGHGGSVAVTGSGTNRGSNSVSRSAADTARANVDRAVASNSALSSLFGTGTRDAAASSKDSKSAKERKDALFTLNC